MNQVLPRGLNARPVGGNTSFEIGTGFDWGNMGGQWQTRKHEGHKTTHR